MSVDTVSIRRKLTECRSRAVQYLNSVQFQSGGQQFWRCSATHDPTSDQGMLLPGTWSGVMAAELIGLAATWTPEVRQTIAASLDTFRGADGYYRAKGGAATSSPEPDEYTLLHVTNYAIGARRLLLPQATIDFPFLTKLLDSPALQAWLVQRDWSNPWKEGNNIVNLASFYAVLAEDGSQIARERLIELTDWHDAHQNPTTGFWHSRAAHRKVDLLNALAGAAHNLHIYYYLHRSVPNWQTIVDNCLRLGYLGVCVACVDIDIADVLVHFRRYGYRVAEIDAILWRLLIELLQVQNADGGFCNDYVRADKQLGYVTPVSRSVTWATWFRLCTIGLIAAALLPAERPLWKFRQTLGMGFCQLDWIADQAPTSEGPVEVLRRIHPELLAARRHLRFTRQRLSQFVRAALVRTL